MNKTRKIDIIVIAVLVLLIGWASVAHLTKSSTEQDTFPAEPEQISDYAQKRLGVMTGSSFDTLAQDKLPNADFNYMNTTADMSFALSQGKIDCFLMDLPIIKSLMQEDERIGYVEENLVEIEFAAMFRKDEASDKLRMQYNAFLKESKSNGVFDELEAIWIDGMDESKKVVDTEGLTGENGTLKFTCVATSPPFAYMKNNEFVGFDVDLMYRFAREYGYDIEISNNEFNAVVTGLQTGMYDIAASAITITEERKESVNFSDPNYSTGVCLCIYNAHNCRLAKESESGSGNGNIFSKFAASVQKNLIREQRWKMILQGMATTVIITVFAVLLGGILAFLICIFRRTGSTMARIVCDVYVKLLQGTPMVVLLMILYYVVFGNAGISAVIVAIVAFGMNFAAYGSEMMRSGIDSIDPGQREAALALGYTERQSFYKFIFPQATRRFLPVLRGEIISLLKNTSIVGYIAIQDLTKMSDIIRSRTYEALFPLVLTAVLYLILSWLITIALKQLEKRMDPKRKQKGAESK